MTDARIVATNPADSSVVPVACNENGELLLAEGTTDQYVEKDGDTMTGNLHLGDKIVLNPDGSAQFADGAVDIYDTGNVVLGSDKITLDVDGNGTFAGALQGKDVIASNGSIKLQYNGGDRIVMTSSGSSFYKNTAYDDEVITISNNSGSGNIVLNGGGSAVFQNYVKAKAFKCTGSQFNFADITKDRVWILKEDANQSEVSLQIGHGSTNKGQKKIMLYGDGRAVFNNDVIVGSRNSRWMLVESGGICHMVEQTSLREDVDTADLVDTSDGPASREINYPQLRNLPQELTMVEQQLQKVMERLRMVPEAGWQVWDGSDEN